MRIKRLHDLLQLRRKFEALPWCARCRVEVLCDPMERSHGVLPSVCCRIVEDISQSKAIKPKKFSIKKVTVKVSTFGVDNGQQDTVDFQ